MKRFKSAFVVFVSAIAVGIILIACGNADEERELPEITGIYAVDVRTEYDGGEHGIHVANVLSDDIVYYSVDKIMWTTKNPQYSVPNEYRVFYRVERNGYKDYEGSALVVISKSVLVGISAENVTVIYDGNKHGIKVRGTEIGDKITYSSDGESEVGEYTVYYAVSREYGEYSGECTLTILPNIRGKYVNAEFGAIVLTADSAILNGDEKPMNYGISGAGNIDGVEFVVDDDVLTIGGINYEKAGDGEIVAELKVNGALFYIKGDKDGIEIFIEFKTDCAEIVCGGKTITTVSGVNFVENVPNRDYSTNNVTMTLVSDTDIVLTNRKRNDETDKHTVVMYDGEYHDVFSGESELLFNVNGKYIAEAPRYKEIGRYEIEAVSIKDGYLPKVISVVMDIAENIVGTYYNENTLLEISSESASVNYESKSLMFENGNWTVGGQAVTVTDAGIQIADANYVKRETESIVAVKSDNVMKVFRHECYQIVLTVDYKAGVLTATSDSGQIIFTFDLSATAIEITANGKVVPQIADENNAHFIIGAGELGADGITRLSVSEKIY